MAEIDYKNIIHELSRELNKSIKVIAKELDEDKNNLYQITAGKNGISVRMANKIVEKYPHINIDYLLYGEGKISLIADKKMDNEILKELRILNKRLEQIYLLLKK